MTRPHLNEVCLADVLPFRPGFATITMSIGQWDALLVTAYGSGWILLELDDDENPVKAYCNEPLPSGGAFA